MILNDTFIIRNVAKETSIEMSLFRTGRPLPPRRRQRPVKRTFTAQDICNKEEFKQFYFDNLGKSVKMDFEGHTYYGYLQDIVVGEHDIEFSYTYISKIQQPTEEDEDRLFPL
jgi:hypothetical protein